jgi:DnaJ-class molecular chaperone
MICIACNGKGYVVFEKQRESVCNDCNGRGEFFFPKGEKNQKQENRPVLPDNILTAHSRK